MENAVKQLLSRADLGRPLRFCLLYRPVTGLTIGLLLASLLQGGRKFIFRVGSLREAWYVSVNYNLLLKFPIYIQSYHASLTMADCL